MSYDRTPSPDNDTAQVAVDVHIPNPTGPTRTPTPTGPRFPVKAILLAVLAVTLIGAAVIGGVCGSGACSNSSSSSSPSTLPPPSLNDGSGFVFVTATVRSDALSPLPSATVYDYQGTPHSVDANGHFGVWARAANGSATASVLVTAPGYFPFLVTVPYNNYTFIVAKPSVNMLPEMGEARFIVSYMAHGSSDGVLQLAWDFFHSITIVGLNHPSLDGKTIKIRAALILSAIYQPPGQLKATTGEALATAGSYFYFDLFDPATNLSIPLPTGVRATITTQLAPVPASTSGPWKLWNLEPTGRWTTAQLLNDSYNNSNNSQSIQFNITNNGYWMIGRTIQSYCVRATVMLTTGAPCPGAQVTRRDFTPFPYSDSVHSLAYSRSNGAVCIEGNGLPWFGGGWPSIPAPASIASGATTFNFNHIPSHGSCDDLEDHCKTVPPLLVADDDNGRALCGSTSPHGAL